MRPPFVSTWLFPLGQFGLHSLVVETLKEWERGKKRKCSLGGGPVTFFDLGLGVRQGHFHCFIVVETVTKSLKSKICHTSFYSTWPYFPLWWRAVREWAAKLSIQQLRTILAKNSLSLLASFNSPEFVPPAKIVQYKSGISKLWGVCVWRSPNTTFCSICLLLPWAVSSQPEIL